MSLRPKVAIDVHEEATAVIEPGKFSYRPGDDVALLHGDMVLGRVKLSDVRCTTVADVTDDELTAACLDRDDLLKQVQAVDPTATIGSMVTISQWTTKSE